MKILRVIARLNVGGPAIQAVLLTRELADRGHHTLLVAGRVPADEGDMGYLARQWNVEPLFLPQLSRRLSALADLRALIALRRILRRERPDIVHTHTAKAGTLGRLAALGTGIPCVHTYHGHVFHGYFPRWKTRGFIWVERLLARRTRRIIAISESQRRDLAETYRIAPARRIAVIRLGFDLTPFSKVAVLRSPHTVSSVLRVGWVGRLTEIKDPLLYIQIAALSTARKHSVQFRMIGDGGMRPQVERAIRDGCPAPRLELVGWRRDMPEIYRGLDILMLTSCNEGTPVAVIEAMAAGCAVIAANVGGVRDLFSGAGVSHDGFTLFDNGVLITERTAAAFQRALERLAGDAQLRHVMGQAAARQAAAHYGHNRLVNDIEALYAQVCPSAAAMPAIASFNR